MLIAIRNDIDGNMTECGDPAWADFVAPFRRKMDMGTYDLHYIDMGQGIPVIMIHGGILLNFTWRDNVQPLVDSGFRVILVDLPGHGRSDIPPDPFCYAVENLGGEIALLVRRLRIGSCHLVGYSIGAVCALYIGMNDLIAVGKTIAINPPALGPPHRLLLTYPGMASLSSILFGRWTLSLYVKAMYHDKKKAGMASIDQYAVPTRKPGFWQMFARLSQQFFSTQFEIMVNNYRSSLIPLLIIWGTKDRWLPTGTAIHLVDNLINSQVIVLPNGGHSPHEECFEQVNPLVLNFLT